MMERWRGLKSLVVDAVDHGSRAVERIQKETASVPFDILEQVPPLAAPAKVARFCHDAGVSGVHGTIRLVTRLTGRALDVALDVIEHSQAKTVEETPSEPAPAPHPASPPVPP
jgi:hypothetical protein